jgi:hypothetical protein
MISLVFFQHTIPEKRKGVPSLIPLKRKRGDISVINKFSLFPLFSKQAICQK